MQLPLPPGTTTPAQRFTWWSPVECHAYMHTTVLHTMRLLKTCFSYANICSRSAQCLHRGLMHWCMQGAPHPHTSQGQSGLQDLAKTADALADHTWLAGLQSSARFSPAASNQKLCKVLVVPGESGAKRASPAQAPTVLCGYPKLALKPAPFCKANCAQACEAALRRGPTKHFRTVGVQAEHR